MPRDIGQGWICGADQIRLDLLSPLFLDIYSVVIESISESADVLTFLDKSRLHQLVRKTLDAVSCCKRLLVHSVLRRHARSVHFDHNYLGTRREKREYDSRCEPSKMMTRLLLWKLPVSSSRASTYRRCRWLSSINGWTPGPRTTRNCIYLILGVYSKSWSKLVSVVRFRNVVLPKILKLLPFCLLKWWNACSALLCHGWCAMTASTNFIERIQPLTLELYRRDTINAPESPSFEKCTLPGPCGCVLHSARSSRILSVADSIT